MEACEEDSYGHLLEVMTVIGERNTRWEEPMRPIEVKQVKEMSAMTFTRAVVSIARPSGLPCRPPRIG